VVAVIREAGPGGLSVASDVFPIVHRQADAELIHGDSLDVLATWPAGSVDLVFADPPYRLSNGGFSCQNGRRASVNKGRWDEARSLDEDHDFNVRWLAECQRVLKPTGTLWVSGTQHVIYSIGFALQGLGFHLLNTVTWLKPNASPNLSCRYFTHSTEILIWASPSKRKPLQHTFNYGEMKAENGGKQMRDVWEIPVPPQSEKLAGRHPTQKPLRLMRRLIAASTNQGDLVLDPFAGSCSTGVAAVELGRRFVGIEREHEYIELGRRRLTMATKNDSARAGKGGSAPTKRRRRPVKGRIEVKTAKERETTG
jgi:site-specific DNA-methyltransferase (adenine-specific)